ncbi:MAG: hypothetical protein M3Q31_24605 [Actinomycetota bacterium]|nr:hypothetical protein [Actinomycetota bacterium]
MSRVLRRPPVPGRAAAAAAIAGGRLYVVGRRALARDAFALSLGSGHWALSVLRAP